MKHNKQDLDQLEKEITSLESLREEAIQASTLQEIRKIFNEVSQKVDIKKIDNKEDNSSIEMKDLNQEIEEAEKRLKNYVNEYDKSYEKMKQIIKKQDEKMETPILLTEEELGDIRIDSINEQYQENEKSISIKKSIDEEKGIIQTLKKKKQKLEETAKNNNVLDNIDAIYFDKDKCDEIAEPEEILVSEIKMDSIKENIEEVPEKIVTPPKNENDIPGDAPEDMEGTTINHQEEVEEKEPLERITIYQDTGTNEYFASDAVLKKFSIIPLSDEVLIEEQACYQVNNDDAEDIIKNSDNDDSNRYEVYLVDIELEEDLNKEIEDEIEEAIVEVEAILNNDDAFTVVDIDEEEDVNQEVKEKKKSSIYKFIIKDIAQTDDKEEILKPINLQASNDFQNELKNGAWEYDVAYSIPEVGKIDNKTLTNISESLMNTAKAKKKIDMVKSRLTDLTKEEIEDLKLEYNALNNKDNIIPNIRELIEDKI